MPEIHGVWVQARSIETREAVDAVLSRIERGHFDTAFVNVFSHGHAYYTSELLERNPDLAPGYDPLAYFIEQANQRDIAVHAWLVAGPVGYRDGPGPILTEHPDWAMVQIDGTPSFWLNYARQDVRQFLSGIVLEIIDNYDVDGIHFDYTRYPGSQWSFDSYSAEAFAQEYGVDLESLRYSTLPAFARFRGNPLSNPSTAQVLAAFDDGQPAVLLNQYGAGQAILLNWDASERRAGASSAIFRRSIDYLSNGAQNVYILRSETNAREYGFSGFEKGFAWIEALEKTPIEIAETELTDLGAHDVRVLPNVCLNSPQTASDLAQFADRGGGIIFIDGPTPSISDVNIQVITGMKSRGRYTERTALLVANVAHALIPDSGRDLDYEECVARDSQWTMFRKQRINALLQQVYQLVQEHASDVLVTATITSDKDRASEQAFVDWPTWLEGEYIDGIVPRAYVDQDQALQPILSDWRATIKASNRVVIGLQVYTGSYSAFVSKSSDRVLSEIRQAYSSGSRGVVLFDIEHMNDELLDALAAGPFSRPVARVGWH